ncbi:uncharacterized protein RSE6_03291 [Rhynchosporium secalis]|uniref:Uncharacterized protein n=1 Tax=Rhynchosporium secalis TaxID=38038 RepID=A0A1E1M2E5_RHYSE|nr:uncharacterized protein RSE6_03291 [Rhynchosporium secalis]
MIYDVLDTQGSYSYDSQAYNSSPKKVRRVNRDHCPLSILEHFLEVWATIAVLTSVNSSWYPAP